jgi:hypothetical protein
MVIIPFNVLLLLQDHFLQWATKQLLSVTTSLLLITGESFLFTDVCPGKSCVVPFEVNRRAMNAVMLFFEKVEEEVNAPHNLLIRF